jgi:hypothetical protein
MAALPTPTQALELAARGDFTALLALRDGASSAAWRVAADASCWMAGIDTEAPPRASVLAGLALTDDDEAVVPACRALVTAAALRGDTDELTALGRLCDGALAQSWLHGDVGELESIERDAAATGKAALVLDAASLRALCLARQGRPEDALEHARRASRMARTEALPQQEYLANIVLARVRRLAGQSYLSARILGALRSFAPAPWHGWIDWELLMATGQAPSGEDTRVAALAALLAGRADVQTVGWALFDEDLARLRAAMGLSAAPDAAIDGWCAGEGDRPPYGLSGVATGSGGVREDGSIACVVCEPNEPARRMIMLGRAHRDEAIAELPGASRSFARTDALIAALALHGDAMPIDSLFKAVWGFKFSPSVHQAVFDTALHRARARLGAHGTIDRTNDEVAVSIPGPLIVPDPRCVSPAEERVLLFVARHGSASAQAASKALDIPLRTAQASLSSLVKDGACHRHKRGRQVAYSVEDTTFQEPTGQRRA